MPLLKFRCKSCGSLFDTLVSASKIDEVRCEECGAEVARAYEGKCLFGMSGSSAGRGSACSGDCSGCSGCGGHASHGGGCQCGACH